MNRVISYSLFGSHPKYIQGALRNAADAHKFYPGWTCRFYISCHTAMSEMIPMLQLRAMDNVETQIIPLGHKYENLGMFWRFLVADDVEVERFLVRDCDSRLSEQEAAAVNEWIADDTILHTCRAHPAHARPINGGLWGATWRRDNWEAPAMHHLIDDWMHRNKAQDLSAYSADQDFLATHVWGWARLSATQHDAVSRGAYPGSKPFPMKWPWPRFMGEVMEIDENGNEFPRPGDWESVPKE